MTRTVPRALSLQTYWENSRMRRYALARAGPEKSRMACQKQIWIHAVLLIWRILSHATNLNIVLKQ